MTNTRQYRFSELNLKKYAHPAGGPDLCAMEAVAYMAGEKHSDRPGCACPAVGAFVRNLNDTFDQKHRDKLKPYIPLMIGTNDDNAKERAKIFGWVAIKQFAPIALRAAGLDEHAVKLESAKTLEEGRVVAARAARAAAAYAAAAYADAAARAAAAYAADAAAYAARAARAAAADTAAYAAYAAAYADAAADAAATGDRDRIFDIALQALEDTLAIGRPDISGILSEIERMKENLPDEKFCTEAVELARSVLVTRKGGE